MKPWIVVAIVLATILMMIAAFFLFAPTLLPSYFVTDNSSRIGVAQIAIETISIGALVLAVYEFSNSQKKPKLKLWLENENHELFHDKDIEIPLSRTNVSANGISMSDDFEFFDLFDLFLVNNGRAAARWVKISLAINHDNPKDTTFINLEAKTDGTWKPEPDNFMNKSQRFDFYGGDSFISYSHKKDKSDIRDWADNICSFRINVLFKGLPFEKKVKLQCSIEASESGRIEQTFTFRTAPPISSEAYKLKRSELERLMKKAQDSIPENVKESIREMLTSISPDIFRRP